jgi:hypothetical protein
MAMTTLAVIADVVASKRVPQRALLQKRLVRTLQTVSSGNSALASPYTLTLGDEFQALYRKANRVVSDLLEIMGEIHPIRARFAIGVGALSTAINSKQALGMDGPAFHRARATLETMKQKGTVLQIAAEPAGEWALINHVLAYLGHHMATWDANRFAILRYRLADVPVAQMTAELGISKVAIHKNIRVAALDEVVAICHEVTAALTRALAA